MSGFVNVEFSKCSICLEGFGPEAIGIAHKDGEKHPFHRICIQNLIEVGNQRDSNYGIQPIKCPVCKVELPRSLSSDPIQNPSPSVRAASSHLSRSVSNAAVSSADRDISESDETEEFSRLPETYFDRLSLERQIAMLSEHLSAGKIDQTAFESYKQVLQERADGSV